MFIFRPIAKTVLLILCILAFTTPAQAETSIYQGSICQPYWGSQAGDFVTRTNGFQNWASSNRSVTCPIDRQVPWYYGSYDTTIWVYLYNYGGSTSCSAYARNRSTGSTYDSDYEKVTATGNQSIALQIRGSGTMYNVSCSLSPNSYIRSFYVSEPE